MIAVVKQNWLLHILLTSPTDKRGLQEGRREAERWKLGVLTDKQLVVCCLYQTRLGVTPVRTYWEQTENIQTHRPVFIPYSFSSFRNLNLFRVEPGHSASVYVQEQLCAEAAWFIIASAPHLLPQLLGLWPLVSKQPEKRDSWEHKATV